MNRYLLLAGALFCGAYSAFGQDYSGDVFRYSDQTITGTARFQGLGGGHVALGGDASSTFTNPAGLGFYNRSELSFSPGVRLQNVGVNYANQNTNSNKAVPFVGQAGLIFAGEPSRQGSLRRGTFGITYSRQVSLGNEFAFTGLNNRSSITDAWAADLNGLNIASGVVDKAFNDKTNQVTDINGVPGTSYLAAAYQLYLIDPTTAGGSVYTGAEGDKVTNQTQSYSSSGSQSQWTLGYGANFNDKLYVGGSLGIASTRFDFTNRYSETFVGGDQIRGLTDLSTLTVRGTGINLSLGAIYRPTEAVQLGATVVSPTFSGLTETYDRTLSADIIGIRQTDANGNPVRFVPALQRIALPSNDFDYTITTPLRASGGATFFFAKRGFITATAEYVGYSGMRVGTSNYQSAADNQAFREDNKKNVQAAYQNVVNFRVGAEVRASMFRFRAGAAYLPSAYKDTFDQLARNGDRNSLLLSGGVGVRNERFFADVAYSAYAFKTAYAPYTLNNSQNYAAAVLNNKVGSALLSVGVFF
ncbi:hypothetical protein J2I47_03850 [Fibrella sp. HMF5335]|uniref:Outer membrane protein transport protein (OMPP1/FadL/TodX) n=1 Tax=Fibrella rubiginis TaxID=2817060 RepID=A0A939GB75_9BACT|nr:hypothetical protein [Fibrella rubiginis]MBO0935674.1 hypothetical protein [Fibrella rubiginis]